MSKLTRLCCWRDWLYRVHVVTGLIAALWLLLVAVTGVMINHQESLGLLDAEISDKYLPDYYRADVRTGNTRLNIIVTDLHSGRIFGSRGHWVGDLIALFLVVSLASGAFSYGAKRRLHQGNHRKEPVPGTLQPLNGKEEWALPVLVADTTQEKSLGDSRSKGVGAG